MNIYAQVNANSGRIDAEIGRPKGDYAKYTGDYEVTPKMDEETVLETAHKVLSDNVTVREIPKYEVANEAGGNTLIIGGSNG